LPAAYKSAINANRGKKEIDGWSNGSGDSSGGDVAPLKRSVSVCDGVAA
jgi:hypothetical protein